MTEQRLRVVQLNAGSLFEPDWERRRHEVVSWLDHLQPDVVCLQEVWESERDQNTAEWIVDQLPGSWHWRFGGHPFHEAIWPDPTLHFGSAVLSRWPIEEAHLFRLPVAEDTDLGVHRIPWELFHVHTAALDVFSAHLAAAPHQTHHRTAQVRAIDEHMRQVRGVLDAPVPFGQRRRAAPAILCGDFNAEPDSDEIRFLCGLTALDGRTTFLQDAWRVAGDGGPGHTQDWRTNPIAASLNVHRKRIDYVFVGDPFLRVGHAGRVLRAAVAFDEPRTGVLASDHCGLVVDVVWPDRPADQGRGG
jgi:endonuclease/exonuclease/phosphatase family metal-dependent hydrolase